MEAMAVESMVASAWEFDGFLTKIRWPVFIEYGYSDIDVIGIHVNGHVRMAECKVLWSPRAVQVVTEGAAAEFDEWITQKGWAKTISNIERIWDTRPSWLPEKRQVEGLEFWLCGNIWFSSERDIANAEAALTRLLRKQCPFGLKGTASARVISTRDLLLDLIDRVRKSVLIDGRGKRFGNPLLDAVRELVRYTHPQPRDGGHVGPQIVEETMARLINAITPQLPE